MVRGGNKNNLYYCIVIQYKRHMDTKFYINDKQDEYLPRIKFTEKKEQPIEFIKRR